ncbi:hypothetical protein Tco_1305566, partial [Tanacetum coccineum]
MDLETTQITTTAKLPTLKQGEYDMWRLMIEQYFQVKDYALWDVIENGNSFKPAAKTTTNVDGTSTTLIPGPYKDAKTLFAAIQTRFSGFRRLNKPDLDTISFDDLYNNFKIIEQEVKGTTSSSSSSQNMAFISSPSSTNEVNIAYRVSTASTQVSPASTQVSTASNQDLEQIHEDDIEEMDLKWQLALLSMRTKRGPRNQDNRNRNQDSSRRTVNVEETSSKAMLAIDGAGFDWSYMADDEIPTNMALMAFLDFQFNKSEFNLANYKRGLASVEEQLVFYKKNEVIFCEQLAVLKKDISYKDSEISVLKGELEKIKQEKESNQLKIKKFDNACKSLDKLKGSQIPDKIRKGLGFVSYNVVPPPPTGLFAPPNLDLSNSGLEKFQQPKFEGYGPKTSKNVCEYTSNKVRESHDAPMVEKLVSDDKSQSLRGNQRNWNNQKSQQLGSEFVKYNKAYFVCGSFDHVHANCNYHQRERVVSGNNYTRVNYNYYTKKAHPSPHDNMAPRAVLMKISPRSLNTARPVNTTHPKTTVYSARPMPKAVNTARPNSAIVNVVRSNQVNVVKGIHKNKIKAMLTVDAQGEEPKEGKLLMCDKKNSVLFTDTGCFVLSSNFKLSDESQVLLKVPRKNTMYSVDMKNIVPRESLTFLITKATLDESMLWHRRL